MTQIVTGKLNGYTFMMADCISHSGSKNTFIDKIVKLNSSDNTYISLSGTSFVMSCVYEYDYWLAINQEGKNDFIKGEESIKKLIDIIKLLYKYEVEEFNNEICFRKHRLFFITSKRAVYYDLTFEVKDCKEIKHIDFEKIELESNQFIDSLVNFPSEDIPDNKDCGMSEIKEICYDDIRKMITNTQLSFDSFKDRFSFILIEADGTILEERPHRYFSDIIANHYGIDYNRIDDADFVITDI